jgi:hypothetical protein
VDKNEKGTVEGRHLQKQIHTMFAELQWNDQLCRADVGYQAVKTLSCFLANARLSGAHIAQMVAVV